MAKTRLSITDICESGLKTKSITGKKKNRLMRGERDCKEERIGTGTAVRLFSMFYKAKQDTVEPW